MFAEYSQKERWLFTAYLIYIFKCMFVAYSQNVCRIFAAYLRTSDGGNGNYSVSLPIILIKIKVNQMLQSSQISSLLVSIL